MEDEVRMAALLKRGLEEDGYAVDAATTGSDALWRASEVDYDAILLDVMLPELDGFEVCRRLRRAGRWMPVLMLTARDSVEDRVHGLDAGADDYLAKPFSFAELSARVRALIRRGAAERPTELMVGDLRLDPGDPAGVAGTHPRRALNQGVRAVGAVRAASRTGTEPDADPRARLGLCLPGRFQRRRSVRLLPAS
jgi:CheY-like chemotaxis protein